MKNRNHLFRSILWIIAVAGITSCSDQQEYPESLAVTGKGIPLSMGFARTSDHTSRLQFGLYIFSRPVGEDSMYRLDSIILPLAETSRLKFGNGQLTGKEYRFLFMATPDDLSALKVVDTDLTTPARGTSWEDIRVIPQGDSISVDNYCQVTDRSAQELLAADTLYGRLSRIVGQMVFRFFKIGDHITDIQPLDLNKVASVFDRIKNIRIDYENYSHAIAFDGQGVPYPKAFQTKQENISQNITTILKGFRLELPQPALNAVNGDPAAGGEIKGYCFLPANRQLRATVTFTYYETTPACGNALHQHNESCYHEETLTLHIPKKSVPGLSVESDAYTVNKAGIRCDRIIDIEYGTNMEIETDWY